MKPSDLKTNIFRSLWNSFSSDLKTNILRFLWNFFPWVVVVLILILGGIMYLLIGGKSARIEQSRLEAVKNDIPAVKVITLTAKPVRLEDKLSLPAQIEAFEELWIKAEVPGQVIKIPAIEGRKVQKGQIIVELDDRDYRTRLARIEANYNMIQQDYNRFTVLAEKKIAAQNKFNEIEARFKDISAQRAEAQLALDRTKITAPIDGQLNDIIPMQGDLLKNGDKVAQVLDVHRVKVKVGVPESDVPSFSNLDESTVIIEALNNLSVKGKKIFLSYQPQNMARLYDLELLIPNTDSRIRPGMFARVELVKKVYENTLMIPLYAIINENNHQFVYIEKTGHAEKRSITPGIMSGWQVQVTSGIHSGDRVIVVGHRQLKEGQPVEVVQNVIDATEILNP